MSSIRPILAAFTCAATIAIAATTVNGAPERSGEAVYEANCANCHSGGFGGFFTGAPKVGKQKDWETLEAKGIGTLTANTINGFGEMAPRAECAVCTDEEIRAAVEYMVEQSQ
ncbi:MAG: c-type cytochrome [Gammaproteobacteria bacterium]